MPHPARLLPLLLGLLFATPWAVAEPPAQPVDPVLKQRLVAAMAAGGGFQDRFDAEVWLTDMSHRLSGKIPDATKRMTLLRQVHAEAVRAGLSPQLVLSVIEVESNFDRFAISDAGAEGLMQVMPFWLKELNRPDDNLFDPAINLRMGCTILRYYLDQEHGNVTRALGRYNGSLRSYQYPYRVLEALRARWHK